MSSKLDYLKKYTSGGTDKKESLKKRLIKQLNKDYTEKKNFKNDDDEE
jgi:hypothetical protein